MGQGPSSSTATHGAGRHFVTGPFDAARDFQLGRYGFDPATQTVWAVIDHCSGATAFGVETTARTRPMMRDIRGGYR